jgi:hypothetical protein
MSTEEKKTQEESSVSSEEIPFAEMMRKMMSQCGCGCFGMTADMMAMCGVVQEETTGLETPEGA